MTSKQLNDQAEPCVREVYAACRGKARSVSFIAGKALYRWTAISARLISQRRFHGKFRAEKHCGQSWLTCTCVYVYVCARAYVVQSFRWLIVERNLRACVLVDHSMNETSIKGSGSNVTFSNYSSCVVLDLSFLQGDRFLLGLINLVSWRPI